MYKPSIPTPAPRQGEQLLGWSFYVFQLMVLSSLLNSLNGMLKQPFSRAEINFAYSALTFVACLWIYRDFLRSNLRPVQDHPILCLQAVILALVAYWFTFEAVNRVVSFVSPDYVNLNDKAILSMGKDHPTLILLSAGFLAPLAEECVFRGLVFRSLWRTSPVAAYLISIVAFSAIHLLGYVGVYSPLHLALAFLQYLPAGAWFAWCYTKSGTIFGPIVTHCVINLYYLNIPR